MPNSIALSKNYTALLDEVYKNASLTSVLDSDASTARQGANANEIIIPMLDMDGLGDYDRNSGYTKGDVKLQHETVAFNYDRGRKFEVDTMDNEESIEVAFGRLGGEFIRTKVVPEADAFTFAKIATKGTVVADGALSGGSAWMGAIEAGLTAMDDAEVPEEGRILFITPAGVNSIKAMQTIESRELLEKLTIVKVPQSRFYTAIDLKDGKTPGEEAGGYAKASGADDINFMIVHKPAIIKFDKHVASNIITPDANQDSDGYIQKYRKYGLVDVYANKTAGVYVSTK